MSILRFLLWCNYNYFYLEIKGQEIYSAKVFSDSLIPEFIDTLNYELNSKAYYYIGESIDHLADMLRFKFDGQEPTLKAIEDIRKGLRSSL